MEFADKNGTYYQLLSPVVEGLGFSIVELSAANRQDGIHISLVIFSPAGVSVKDCEKVHRLAAARAEVASDTRDVYFEVSSPGINRNIKHADEFALFTGYGVKVLCDGDSEWMRGILEASGEKGIIIDNKIEKSRKKIPYSQIKKAKLDFSWEEA
ncbi:MAG: ribosome maturation factor RimP [Spirochaetia bacterium]|nr:ribosome maturation factor RimP [Spirochaetia bacterium]